MSPPPGSPTRPEIDALSLYRCERRRLHGQADSCVGAGQPDGAGAARRQSRRRGRYWSARPAPTRRCRARRCRSPAGRPRSAASGPATFRSASIARPPPCTTTSGSRFARRTIAAADAATALASSSSSPPSFRTVATSVQPRRFGKSEGHVEVLNRLAGGALHQVVDARHHHELTAIGAKSASRCRRNWCARRA